MPELPEVETVRGDLAKAYIGVVLDSVVVTGRRTVRRHAPELLASLEGRTLVSIGRHGKYLLFRWDDGQVLVAHLRMSGQLLTATEDAPRRAHTHAVLHFAGAGELHFVDPRTFGELFLARPGGRAGGGDREWQLVAEVSHMGPDALDVTPGYLAEVFKGRRAWLKALLVDQRVVAGIGNIYADEICFEARLRPDRPAGSLTPREVGHLVKSLKAVLGAAIVARGSTLGDQQYRDLNGAIGAYQLQHQAYGRQGRPCSRCGTPILRAKTGTGAKSAFFCPRCQH